MNRREFLRNAAIIAAGAIAADQLELLERLAPRRLLFAGADFGSRDAYYALFTSYWRLQCTPRNNALLTGLTAETRARVPEIFPDHQPATVLGRRLIVPVRTARGIDEITYERVRKPLS